VTQSSNEKGGKRFPLFFFALARACALARMDGNAPGGYTLRRGRNPQRHAGGAARLPATPFAAGPASGTAGQIRNETPHKVIAETD
jgi:hypothetical protein